MLTFATYYARIANMFQRSFFLLVLVLITATSCEEEMSLESVISDTKDLQWKRCGFYQNQYSAKIYFNVTDSLNDGWYLEEGDTSFFYFTVINNETVQIDSSSNSAWSGELKVERYSKNSILFERTYKSCDSELFYFQ